MSKNKLIFWSALLCFICLTTYALWSEISRNTAKCSFNSLKREEENFGFSERWGNENFFRKGLIDEWKSKLSTNLIKLIENKFKREMIELDYL